VVVEVEEGQVWSSEARLPALSSRSQSLIVIDCILNDNLQEGARRILDENARSAGKIEGRIEVGGELEE